MLKIALKTPYYSLWKPLQLVSKCLFSYLDERGAERCLGRAQNNLGRATFEDPQQVQAAVAKIPKKYDVMPLSPFNPTPRGKWC